MCESHFAQISYLQKKNIITIPDNDIILKTFIEMTERRNLFVHTDGLVSRQYIDNCKIHKIPENMQEKFGEKLDISDNYFKLCADSLLELGMRLGHSIWRKLIADELISQNRHYSEACYSLIQEGAYNVAVNLAEFSLSPPMKFDNEPSRRQMIVNLAQAYKWLGNSEKCHATLSREDWSGSRDPFLLAIAVLQDDFPKAAKIMRHIGKVGEVQKHEYLDWPLFKEFRKSSDFRKSFADIYGGDEEIVDVTNSAMSTELASNEISAPVPFSDCSDIETPSRSSRSGRPSKESRH